INCIYADNGGITISRVANVTLNHYVITTPNQDIYQEIPPLFHGQLLKEIILSNNSSYNSIIVKRDSTTGEAIFTLTNTHASLVGRNVFYVIGNYPSHTQTCYLTNGNMDSNTNKITISIMQSSMNMSNIFSNLVN